MTDKKLTKAQKKKMLLDAILIAEGAQDPTPTMSYVDAWQHLVDTGECWKLQGFFARSVTRMISDGTLIPPNPDEDAENNEPKDDM